MKLERRIDNLMQQKQDARDDKEESGNGKNKPKPTEDPLDDDDERKSIKERLRNLKENSVKLKNVLIQYPINQSSKTYDRLGRKS